jgi:DNA invertase Pin-like site-specific DNA recombinase
VKERVGIYARVSTLDKGQDVELQLSELRTYAAARGWEIFKEYVDMGQSGSKEHRPSFNKLMEDARRRKIDIVLVWRLDRFGRSLKHLVVSLDELKTLGVGFISLKESLDFTTSTGRLMLHLLAAFAEFEKDLIRERVIAGVAHARAKGKRLGRPNGDVDLQKLLDLGYQHGLSIREISKEMSISTGLVHKSLRNYPPQSIDNSRVEYQKMSVH